MEVAPRYTLLTLLTMFTLLAWFTLIPKHPNWMRLVLNIPTEKDLEKYRDRRQSKEMVDIVTDTDTLLYR